MMTTDIRKPMPQTVYDLFNSNFTIYSQDIYSDIFLIQSMNLNPAQR